MTTPSQGGRRNRWLLAAVLLIGAFLSGFVPQYLNNRRAAVDLQARDQQIKNLQHEATLSRVRDLASLLYLETSRKNYGIASQRATTLFDLIRATINNSSEPALKEGLRSLLAQRDEITSKLAKPDPGVEKDVQDLLDRLYQLTFK